jgi:hypothetical protein
VEIKNRRILQRWWSRRLDCSGLEAGTATEVAFAGGCFAFAAEAGGEATDGSTGFACFGLAPAGFTAGRPLDVVVGGTGGVAVASLATGTNRFVFLLPESATATSASSTAKTAKSTKQRQQKKEGTNAGGGGSNEVVLSNSTDRQADTLMTRL